MNISMGNNDRNVGRMGQNYVFKINGGGGEAVFRHISNIYHLQAVVTFILKANVCVLGCG